MIKNPIPWPQGARCAVAFTFDMDAESLMHLYFPDTAPNRVAMAAMLRYDAQVAVPRPTSSSTRFSSTGPTWLQSIASLPMCATGTAA